MRHAGGRPKGSTKYRPILAEKLNAYVDECYEKHRIPWIEWFCIQNKVSKRTFYHWAKQNEDLNYAREMLMTVQELALLQLCISGQGNTRAVIHLLKRTHGYREARPQQPKVRGIEAIFI